MPAHQRTVTKPTKYIDPIPNFSAMPSLLLGGVTVGLVARAQPTMAYMSNKTTRLLAVAAIAACTRHMPVPPPATPAAPTPQPTSAVEFQPGPHSPLADVDLPAGVTFAGSSSIEESWNYSVSYDDTVAFLRKQFATGRKYDTRGATWWRDLPPCYNGTRHESPPWGWVMDDSTLWVWADANTLLSVEVFRPSSTITPNEIVINYMRRDNSHVCNRA